MNIKDLNHFEIISEQQSINGGNAFITLLGMNFGYADGDVAIYAPGNHNIAATFTEVNIVHGGVHASSKTAGLSQGLGFAIAFPQPIPGSIPGSVPFSVQ